MTSHFPADHDGSRKKTPQEIEAEIVQTRSAITEDIKALGDKLSPESLKQGARDVLRDAKEEASDMLRTAKEHAIESVTETMSELGDKARRAGHVTGDFVSANAIPLAMIGIGAGWLMLTMRHQRASTYHSIGSRFEADEWQRQRSYAENRTPGLAERAREGAHDLRVNAAEKIEAAGTRVKETASHLGQRANELTHDARDQLMLAQRRTRDFAHENPMAMGALAIAAGVGVGMLLPMTRPENQLMGPTRDRLLGEARTTARRVTRTARETAGEIKDVLTETPLR